MKRFYLLAFLVAIATVLYAANSSSVCSKEITSHHGICCTAKVEGGKKCGKCQEGTLVQDIVYVKKTCHSCEGKGYHEINRKRTKCDTCKGKGKVEEPVTRWVCNKCGAIYKSN